MSTETPEAKELSLVSKVELRIAVTASDEKLQLILNTYLAPLLLKLASDYTSVRNKVISICQHINARIKLPTIQVPVATLLKQFKDHLNPLVRHFDLLYIQQGIGRLPVSERLNLLPTLSIGMKDNYEESAAHTAILFNLLLKLLHSMAFPPRGAADDVGLRQLLGLADHPEDATFIATWLGRVILFQSSSVRCAGLSTMECTFIQLHGKIDTWNPAADGGLNLIETKIIISKFLASGAFIDTDRFLPALYMSADPNSKLSSLGEDLLKRAISKISYDDPTLVRDLYSMYLGTGGDSSSLPAPVPLKVKILSLLCRSKLALSFSQENSQIIQEALTLGAIHPSGSSQISSRGLEASKLRSQAFAFINWIARMSSRSEKSLIAPGLVGHLRDYIERQGWPRPHHDSTIDFGDLSSRAFGYESIGLLAEACPNQILLDPNLDALRWLFTSLSEDSCGSDVSLSIEQALSSVLGAFDRDLPWDMQIALISLLSHHMSLHPKGGDESGGVARSTRFMALKFANRCLPYHNIKARLLNVLALCGGIDERKEVIEEGRRGLNPYWFKMLNSSQSGSSTNKRLDSRHSFPDFSPLVFLFFGPESDWDMSRLNNPQMADAFISGLSFCRNILLHQILASQNSSPLIDVEWERRIDALIANNEAARSSLCKGFHDMLITNEEFSRALRTYLYACFNGFTSSGGQEISRAGEFLIEIFPLIPSSQYDDLAKRIAKLKEPIIANNKDLRERSARIFGVLASLKGSPASVLENMIQIYETKIMNWQLAVGSQAVQIHGAILATAFFISRCNRRDNIPVDLTKVHRIFIQTIWDILNQSRDKLLQEAALVAIADLALFGVLIGSTLIDVSNILEKLGEKSMEGNEKAILALGQVSMQCHEDNTAESILTKGIKYLYDLHTIRGPEIQFSVGAALTCAASGLESKFLVAAIDVESSKPSLASRQHTLNTVLEKVLADCKTSKPTLRQAAVIWLLCMVQYCGHLEVVQNKLRACQIVFKSFLADRDSINQESGSRGLTIIYEIGSRELKDELIRDLMGSFTGTSSNLAGGQVSGDTELFEPGALPTNDGSITTYKDIMNLAAEVGDSSLVYRFMSLASNNAIWSSRAAFGRFGLSKVLSDASADGYLAQNPKLYSALFRYRFDPNTKVRNSMNDIWMALVKEPTATVNANFDFIIMDLLKNMLGKEWRVRQASCAAVADLLQGRSLETYEKYLSEIWTMTFKVCDDIKESVRAAAMSLARILTSILTRGLEVSESSAKKADTMLGQVLPFLLGPNGLESCVPEVQNFSRKTVIEIIKKGNGKRLQPFIPELIGRLLALLTSIEPEMINYIHLNAEKYGVKVQELDDARLKYIRGSQMLESIEHCLDLLDESSMIQLQIHLEGAIRAAIGLPSKVGCSRVLISLSTRQNFIFKPYAESLLPLARKQVLDQNDTISSSYAIACAYLSRLVSDGALLDHIRYCRRLYFESDDDRHRVIAGNLIHAVSKHATDRFGSFASEALPFTFIARHDVIEKARTLFDATWNESVGGRRAVSLYLSEIVNMVLQHVDSARWSIKHASAYAIADVVTLSGTTISDAKAKIMWKALEKALTVKTWEGKEKILEALILLARNSTLLSSDNGTADQMCRIVIREAQRNNFGYRPHALKCIGSFAELQKSADIYDPVLDVVSKILKELLSRENDMDLESLIDRLSSRMVCETTLANAASALLKAMNPLIRTGEALDRSMGQTFDVLIQADDSSFASKSLKVATYENLQGLFGRMQAQSMAMSKAFELHLTQYAKLTFSAFDEVEHIRLKAAEAAIAMASIVKRGGTTLNRTFADDLNAVRLRERSTSVEEKLKLADQILKGDT